MWHADGGFWGAGFASVQQEGEWWGVEEVPMSDHSLAVAEREVLAAEDALASTMAHGDRDAKAHARERLREAQRRVNRLAEGALARR